MPDPKPSTTENDHMGTLDDDERCHRCGGENVRWSAPSPLWNRVMRGNDIDGEPRYRDLVCIRCFIVLAYKEGIDGTWRVSVDPEPDGLIYETPSGRIWDRSRSLWVDPPVQDNTILDTRKHGIYIAEGAGCLVEGNKLDGIGLYHVSEGNIWALSDNPSSPGERSDP